MGAVNRGLISMVGAVNRGVNFRGVRNEGDHLDFPRDLRNEGDDPTSQGILEMGVIMRIYWTRISLLPPT